MRSFIKLITALLLSVTIGPVAANFLGFSAEAGVLGMIGLSLLQSVVPMPAELAFMAVQVEIWQKDIQESLFRDNSFLNFAFNADQYVLNGAVVHLPQAGTGGDVVKNRDELPATVKKRSDSDVTYALDEFTSDPILIPNADKVELSYDKRQSVISEEQGNLNERVAEELIYIWGAGLPAEYTLATSGSAAAATAPGATGDRLMLTRADLQKAQTRMNRLGIPKNDRYALVPSEMVAQLFPPDSQITALYMQNVTKEEQQMGVIGIVHGFRIIDRGSVLIVDGSGTVKVPEADSATDDREAVICWQKNAVERALGEIKFFENTGDPQYYGDVYSFLVRMGGRRRRSDDKGVIAIVQEPPV